MVWKFKFTSSASKRYFPIVKENEFEIPKKSLDPESVHEKQENRRIYFPELMTSLEKYENENPTQNPDYFTSALTSTVFMDSKRKYKVGDVFEARIQPKERTGGNKIFGGDDFPIGKENEFETPKESLDPESAYYGMTHKDTYGLPLRDFGLETFHEKQENWRIYFPELMTSLEKYENENPTQNPDYFTSALTSTVFMDTKRQYKVGDVFEARIQSKERTGRNKRFGGDYFRARLFLKSSSNQDTPDGIPCTIEDEMNGNYTIKAPLTMSGNFTLEVKLVVPLEGIEKLITLTETANERHSSFYSLLSSIEIVRCGVGFGQDIRDNDLCDYSNPRNREPWFCLKPPSNICGKRFHCYSHHHKNYFYVSEEEMEKYSFGARNLSSQVEEFVVKDSENLNGFDLINSSQISGYASHSRWVSLVRPNKLISIESSKICFKNKVVYFIGDSTIRQFFYAAVETFKLEKSGPDNSKVWQNPQIARGHVDNIAMYYRAHGPPLLNAGPPSSRPYISDSIDGIAIGGSDVYVIFNIGSHTIGFGASFYIHRLKGIKAAILRHLSKFPQTRFILRGMNVVEYTQEWLIRRYDVILRHLFKEIYQVAFVDLWDLTTVWPLPGYHPQGRILTEEALLLYDYICHW